MQGDIHIKPLNVNDFTIVLNLADELLGVDYISIKDLHLFLQSQSGIVAWKNERPVGFLFWNKQLPQHLEKQYEDKETLYLQTIIVNPQFQKQGVGLKLITEFTNRFKNMCIIAQAWSVDGHCNAELLNLKVGFKKIYTQGKIWKSDCEAKKFICPSYTGTCKCEAILFEKQ